MEWFKGRGQWILLGVVLVGLFLYRTIFGGSAPLTPEDLAAREPEINNLFLRLPPYPGSQEPKQAKEITPGSIIVERVYPAQAEYEQVRAFYLKEADVVGWETIGQQPNVPGFTTPVQVFRSGDYHLLLTVSPTSIRLRIVLGDLAQLIGQKLLPD